MLLWHGDLSLYLGPTQKCFNAGGNEILYYSNYWWFLAHSFITNISSDISKLQSSDRKLNYVSLKRWAKQIGPTHKNVIMIIALIVIQSQKQWNPAFLHILPSQISLIDITKLKSSNLVGQKGVWTYLILLVPVTYWMIWMILTYRHSITVWVWLKWKESF